MALTKLQIGLIITIVVLIVGGIATGHHRRPDHLAHGVAVDVKPDRFTQGVADQCYPHDVPDRLADLVGPHSIANRGTHKHYPHNAPHDVAHELPNSVADQCSPYDVADQLADLVGPDSITNCVSHQRNPDGVANGAKVIRRSTSRHPANRAACYPPLQPDQRPPLTYIRRFSQRAAGGWGAPPGPTINTTSSLRSLIR